MVSDGMFVPLVVVLAMARAVLVTRDTEMASYEWVLGVVLLCLALAAASVAGLSQGVDQSGRPQDAISRNLPVVYAGVLLVCGALGGAIVDGVRQGWRRWQEPGADR